MEKLNNLQSNSIFQSGKSSAHISIGNLSNIDEKVSEIKTFQISQVNI